MATTPRIGTKNVFKKWRYVTMLRNAKPTSDKVLNYVIPESDDSTLDKIWGLTPVYAGVRFIRRRRA